MIILIFCFCVCVWGLLIVIIFVEIMKYFKEYYKVCYKFIDIMVFIFYLEIVNKYILNNWFFFI